MEQGNVTSALGVVRDVTEERRLAEQLLRREKLAAVGQLVSGVAHELNNPLAGILAFSQLLLAAPAADASIRDGVMTINKEAKRAAKIISNLLLFSRQRPPERTTSDLNRVITDALELRTYALNADQIEVETNLDPELPAIWADPFQLQQVFINLITNAEHALREHNGPKRVTIQTRNAGDALEAIVADTGPGVPPDVVDRIFNPFFSTKRVGEGTGLGLSISDAIVREHGGQIVAASAVGEGTGAVFIVRLPLTAMPAAPSPSKRSRQDAVPLAILLADDDSEAASRLGTHLRAAGHKVEVASSGREVLARMAAMRFDVILLDADGQSVRGEDVFATILGRDAEAAARVVFTTGAMEGETSRRFFRRAGRPVVRKPWSAEAVAELLYAEARRR
jgi:two-component system NtrC family sensor kinase